MRDRMPPEMLARAKGQAQNTNELNQLALKANGFGVSRADQRKAEADLVRLAPRKAKQLMQEAAKKVRDTF